MQQLSSPAVTVGLLVLGDNTGAFVGAILGCTVGDLVVTGKVVGLNVVDDVGALVSGGTHSVQPVQFAQRHLSLQSFSLLAQKLLQINGLAVGPSDGDIVGI